MTREEFDQAIPSEPPLGSCVLANDRGMFYAWVRAVNGWNEDGHADRATWADVRSIIINNQFALVDVFEGDVG